MLLTALLSNNAAVALMFPIAWEMNQLNLKTRMYILMYAASGMLLITINNYISLLLFLLFLLLLTIVCIADFSTPFGYATNLMVYGPGGYQ